MFSITQNDGEGGGTVTEGGEEGSGEKKKKTEMEYRRKGTSGKRSKGW